MDAKNPTKIKVFGVGGGGSNAVARMFEENLEDVELYIVNTDQQHLDSLPVPNKIRIGEQLTRGLGAGARPDIGEAAAQESIDQIKEALRGADAVFIAAGLGGGTGTGASPVIAQAAKEMGILTIAVVTKPFAFEGKKRAQIAEEGLRKISEVVDTYIVINNQRLVDIAQKRFSFMEAFKMVDDILYTAVKAITDVILKPGIVNVDFADVKTIMENGGKALIGIGAGKGKSKLEDAVEKATSSPLLEGVSIRGAKRLLLHIECSPDTTFDEVNEVATMVRENAHEDAEIIFGVGFDHNLEDQLKIEIIATAFEDEKPKASIPQQNTEKTIPRVRFRPNREVEEEPKETEPPTSSGLVNEVDFDELEIPAYIRKKKGQGQACEE
ncbi:MAG: cell division protein FtsZ [Aquificae bacterium]|nr:cell division protein FtsZ [Aquificota bacterium]